MVRKFGRFLGRDKHHPNRVGYTACGRLTYAVFASSDYFLHFLQQASWQHFIQQVTKAEIIIKSTIWPNNPQVIATPPFLDSRPSLRSGQAFRGNDTTYYTS